LLALLPNLSVGKVTTLEPRTSHQPEKLKKLSKNDYLSTLSIFQVNEKPLSVTACVFNRVQPVHRLMTGFGAGAALTFPQKPCLMRNLAWRIDENQCASAAKDRFPVCENP
jgi:hypothetical protein